MVLEQIQARSAPSSARSVVGVIRVALALTWLVWAVLAWWSSPRQADRAQFDADFRAGRIAAFGTADTWQQPRLWGAPANLRNFGSGSMLVWKTSNGQTFYMDLQPSRFPDSSLETGSTSHLVKDLQDADVPGGVQGGLVDIASSLGLLMIVSALGTLLGGPDPVRGTRWFWFWFGQLPFGLGYLAWLAMERPWADPATVARNRGSGWTGFGCLLLGSLAIGMLVSVAGSVLGPWAIPR